MRDERVTALLIVLAWATAAALLLGAVIACLWAGRPLLAGACALAMAAVHVTALDILGAAGLLAVLDASLRAGGML